MKNGLSKFVKNNKSMIGLAGLLYLTTQPAFAGPKTPTSPSTPAVCTFPSAMIDNFDIVDGECEELKRIFNVQAQAQAQAKYLSPEYVESSGSSSSLNSPILPAPQMTPPPARGQFLNQSPSDDLTSPDDDI